MININEIALSILDEKEIKKVVRAGKIVKKVFCNDGQKAKDGKCVKMTGKEKLIRKKAAKKAVKSKKGKSSVKANKKRAKSMKKSNKLSARLSGN